MHSQCTEPTTLLTADTMDALNAAPPVPIALKVRGAGYVFTWETNSDIKSGECGFT